MKEFREAHGFILFGEENDGDIPPFKVNWYEAIVGLYLPLAKRFKRLRDKVHTALHGIEIAGVTLSVPVVRSQGILEKVYTILKLCSILSFEVEVFLLIVITCFHLQVAETPTRKRRRRKNDVENLNSLVASVKQGLTDIMAIIEEDGSALREHFPSKQIFLDILNVNSESLDEVCEQFPPDDVFAERFE
jgi:mevalonate kinase